MSGDINKLEMKMKISDLTYIDNVTATSSLSGGRRKKGRRYSPVLKVQSNTAIVYQGARSNARGLAYGGDAIAIASSKNDSIILQGNA